MKKLVSIALTLCMLLSLAVIAPLGDIGLKASAGLTYTGATRNSGNFIIDPGHGGADPGAINGSRHEADDVLRLSIAVAKLIDQSGATCALTRVTDITQSMPEKVAIANNGNFTYFVSIHRNAGGGKGVETYYNYGLSTSSPGAQLATSIQNHVIGIGCWVNRGVKSAAFYVIKNTTMAAALIEVGFMDSPDGMDSIIFDQYFDANATAIANGMLAMIGKSVAPAAKYEGCVDKPVAPDPYMVNGPSNISATVTQTGENDVLTLRGWTMHTDGISKVEYSIDNGGYNALIPSVRDDVVEEIKGYSDYSNCGYDGEISYKNLTAGVHTITIRATTKKNATYTAATINLTVNDPINPAISNIKITNITKEGYRISCNVTDNAGLDRVVFPTWSGTGGQDDMVWYDGIIEGNYVYADVKISNHNNAYDGYSSHIYAYDISGNESFAGGGFVNLTEDTTAPTISNAVITNVSPFGFDVSCTITEDKQIAKVQFPTWTDADGQDDIAWYDANVSENVATFHVDTSKHGNQSGLYHVHLIVTDAWGHEAKAELSVNVTAVTKPADSNYIPINAINGNQSTTDSQALTSGTFTSQTHGVLVLEAVAGGYKVTAKYDAGVAKSVVATVAKPVVAVSKDLVNAYNVYLTLNVGDIVTFNGVDLTTNRAAAGAYVAVPAKFQLVDSSTYKLDTKYVTVDKVAQTVQNINNEFKCAITVVDHYGIAVEASVIAGTGYVVQYLSATGEVLNSATVVIIGDITGDGVITAADSICSSLLVKGTASYTEAQNKAADVNEDGVMSTLDYVSMKNLCKA